MPPTFQTYIHYAEVALFLGFGLKLLYDAQQMSAMAELAEVTEAEAVVAQADAQLPQGQTQWAIIWEAFSLTFLLEWGDRTQFATIALAVAQNPWGVTLGAILGHSICAAIAVGCGRLIAGRISERVVTFLGGLLFLIFGIIAWLEGH